MDTIQKTLPASPSVSGRATIRPRLSPRAKRRMTIFYTFIAPWLLGFILLNVLPLTTGFLISLTNYDGLNPFDTKFKGADNYLRLLDDPEAIASIGRTALWSALNVPLWLVVSFFLALLLHQNIKGRGLFRTIFYLPSVLPAVTTVWVWRIFLDNNAGLLNYLISFFRPGTAIRWLSDYALQALTIISVWSGVGGGMLVFLAGLQGIPDEIQDAARIDGADGWQLLRHIVVPLMTPVIFYNLILALIYSLQELSRPLLLGNLGGQSALPPRSTYLYMLHVWRQIFSHQRYGYGNALVWLMCIVIIILSFAVFWSSKYWVHYEVAVEGDRKGGQA